MDTIKSKATVTRHGDDWVIVVNRSLLDLLQIEGEATLDVTTDGQSLVLTPEQTPERRAAFLASVEEMDRQYGSVFKRLAE